jgi:hypothetical protein
VIAQIAPDFTLLDAWALPAEGTREDFFSFVETMAALDPAGSGSVISRFLFWVRFRLGDVFGWDEVEARPIPGCTETSLSARLPEELRGSATRPAIGDAAREAAGGFVPLYRTDDEWAAEISNATVHGVLHLGWVEVGEGRYRGQLGVYVKARGRLGGVYLTLIAPFRHLIVYPAMMRQIGRAWDTRRLTPVEK